MFGKYILKSQLHDCFRAAELCLTYKHNNHTQYIYPTINSILRKHDKTLIIFNLLNGTDPKVVKKKEFVFMQYFGKNIELKGDLKKYVLTIYKKNSQQDSIKYDYNFIKKQIDEKGYLFPIVAGMDRSNNFHMYDATNNPNLLIFGQPGSGKSSILHVIHSTLIQMYTPDELHIYMADFKMSEFNVYEGVKHVKSVCYLAKELAPVLTHLKNELAKRGELLKQYKVRHVNKLPKDKKPPYILLTIDEFVMIKDDDIMADLLQICSLGRAYGLYITLAMQRPSHKILSTDVRGVISARMGFRVVDKTNAKIGETPGSEKISKEDPGRFLLNLDELIELKSPYLDEDETEKILDSFKDDNWKNHNFKKSNSGLVDDVLEHKSAVPEQPSEIDLFL